jgi:hypothetical protein
MTATFFPPIHRWYIPEGAVAGSLAELALDGREGNEGVALWLGRRRAGEAEVTHLVALRGAGVVKRPDLLRIEPWLLNEVADAAIELGVNLVGQIHSHGRGWVDLSRTDRADGITVPHYLSIIAPWFGLRPETRLADCGAHVFEPSQGWRRLTAPEVEARLCVVPGAQAPLISVGEE